MVSLEPQVEIQRPLKLSYVRVDVCELLFLFGFILCALKPICCWFLVVGGFDGNCYIQWLLVLLVIGSGICAGFIIPIGCFLVS